MLIRDPSSNAELVFLFSNARWRYCFWGPSFFYSQLPRSSRLGGVNFHVKRNNVWVITGIHKCYRNDSNYIRYCYPIFLLKSMETKERIWVSLHYHCVEHHIYWSRLCPIGLWASGLDIYFSALTEQLSCWLWDFLTVNFLLASFNVGQFHIMGYSCAVSYMVLATQCSQHWPISKSTFVWPGQNKNTTNHSFIWAARSPTDALQWLTSLMCLPRVYAMEGSGLQG